MWHQGLDAVVRMCCGAVGYFQRDLSHDMHTLFDVKSTSKGNKHEPKRSDCSNATPRIECARDVCVCVRPWRCANSASNSDPHLDGRLENHKLNTHCVPTLLMRNEREQEAHMKQIFSRKRHQQIRKKQPWNRHSEHYKCITHVKGCINCEKLSYLCTLPCTSHHSHSFDIMWHAHTLWCQFNDCSNATPRIECAATFELWGRGV